MRLLLASFAFALMIPTTDAAEMLKVKTDASTITFVGSKPSGEKHDGGFKTFTSVLSFEPHAPESSRLEMDIQTSSMFSDNGRLTGHLKGTDFFNVRRYPKATFKSTEIVKAGEDVDATHIIRGEMSICGQSQEVEIPVTVEISDSTVKITGVYTMDRFDFGIAYGKGVINAEVPVTFAFTYAR